MSDITNKWKDTYFFAATWKTEFLKLFYCVHIIIQSSLFLYFWRSPGPTLNNQNCLPFPNNISFLFSPFKLIHLWKDILLMALNFYDKLKSPYVTHTKKQQMRNGENSGLKDIFARSFFELESTHVTGPFYFFDSEMAWSHVMWNTFGGFGFLLLLSLPLHWKRITSWVSRRRSNILFK